MFVRVFCASSPSGFTFLLPPPGPPWSDGPPVAPPRAHRFLRGPSLPPRRGKRLPGVRGGPHLPGQDQPGPTLPAPVLVSGFPAALPESTRRLNVPSPGSPPAPPFAHPMWLFQLPVPSSHALCGPSRSPSGPHARVRSFSLSPQAVVRVRGLSRRADSAFGLPRPRRSRVRPGDTALPPGRARALSSPARLLPGLPTKDGRGCRGGARAPPLFSPARGSLFGNSLSTSCFTRALELQALDPAERPTWA